MRRALLAALALLPVVGFAPPSVAQDVAQPRLPTEPLTIVTRDGPRRFTVEMAVDPGQQMVGLMWRTEVKPDEGMLFDWGQPRESTMWMRNTVTSLDMVFITQEGRVLRVAERTVPRSLATISSGGPVRATLELAAGTAERLGIRVGDRVEHRIFGAGGR